MRTLGAPAQALREKKYSAGEQMCEAAIMPPFGGTGEALALTPSPSALVCVGYRARFATVQFSRFQVLLQPHGQ